VRDRHVANGSATHARKGVTRLAPAERGRSGAKSPTTILTRPASTALAPREDRHGSSVTECEPGDTPPSGGPTSDHGRQSPIALAGRLGAPTPSPRQGGAVIRALSGAPLAAGEPGVQADLSRRGSDHGALSELPWRPAIPVFKPRSDHWATNSLLGSGMGRAGCPHGSSFPRGAGALAVIQRTGHRWRSAHDVSAGRRERVADQRAQIEELAARLPSTRRRLSACCVRRHAWWCAWRFAEWDGHVPVHGCGRLDAAAVRVGRQGLRGGFDEASGSSARCVRPSRRRRDRYAGRFVLRRLPDRARRACRGE
jgi:hypothetical protein